MSRPTELSLQTLNDDGKKEAVTKRHKVAAKTSSITTKLNLQPLGAKESA